MPFFNRSTGSATRFIKLRDVPEESRSPPLTLVLHARAGTAMGDMASYDYFTLGGPFSVCIFTDSEDSQLSVLHIAAQQTSTLKSNAC